jgi:hypothetical protein
MSRAARRKPLHSDAERAADRKNTERAIEELDQRFDYPSLERELGKKRVVAGNR